MKEFQKEYWQKFEKSGQIADYLNYKAAQRSRAEEIGDPLRRIEKSSLYKKFY